jgi:hypothetical protein
MRSYERCFTAVDRIEKKSVGNSMRKCEQQQKRKCVAGPKHHFILNERYKKFLGVWAITSKPLGKQSETPFWSPYHSNRFYKATG